MSQAGFESAAVCHALLLNVTVPSLPVVRNASRPAFGFGGLLIIRARNTLSSPVPSEPGAAAGVGFAETMRAPLTWSGVQFGCWASSIAAAPETIGAEKEVPLNSM